MILQQDRRIVRPHERMLSNTFSRPRSRRAGPMSRYERHFNSLCRKSRRAFSNDFSILNPTLWANEAIIQLLPNMVMGQLISRDFDNTVSRFGDIVNAFVPSKFVMNRKGSLCDPVVVQDATGSRIQVALNQWPQVSFLICDGEENRDQLDLVDTLMTPAVIAMATGIDSILNKQVYQFVTDNVAGHANNLDSSNVRSYILDAREQLNRKNVPMPGRTLILSPGTETEALQVDALTLAMDVGDKGEALREAALGRKYGFDIFMTQTQPEVTVGQPTLGTNASISTSAAAGAKATTLALTGSGAGSGGANLAIGQWLLVAGDDTPQQITAVSTLTVTIQPGLRRAVASGAAVTIIAPGAINNGPGYVGTSLSPRVIGWSKEILVDGFDATFGPQIGQMVTFGTDVVNRYAIIGLNLYGGGAYGLVLDTPLVSAITNNMVVNLGPAAKYNFGFLRNAFTLVNRPLAEPRIGTGAISKVIVDPVNKIAIRVTITYDGSQQGHLVTLDTLMGVGTLSRDMGVVLLG